MTRCAYWSDGTGLTPCDRPQDEHDFGVVNRLSRDYSHHAFLAPGERRDPVMGGERHDWYARSLAPELQPRLL